MPIYISPSVRIKQLKKGDIILNCSLKRSLIQIGFEGTYGLEQQKSVIFVANGGKIVFNGAASILAGTSMLINGGTLSIGHKFVCNDNCYLFCRDRNITIGDYTIFGWNVVLNTFNGHPVKIGGEKKEIKGDIKIGNHVWLCSYCHVGKNVTIADGCIVSQNALVTSDQLIPNSLIAGSPARMIKENVEWELELD